MQMTAYIFIFSSVKDESIMLRMTWWMVPIPAEKPGEKRERCSVIHSMVVTLESTMCNE